MATAPPSRRRARATANKTVSRRSHSPSANGLNRDLRAVVAAMGDLVFVLDANGQFLEAVTDKNNFLQYSPAEIVGRRIQELFPADERANLTLNLIRRALEIRQTVNYEYTFRYEGKDRWLAVMFLPVADDRVVCVARDVTEQRQFENLSEIQRSILELIASGTPPNTVLMTLAETIEARSPGLLCSIMRLESDGRHLRNVVAPSLSEGFVRAIEGIAVGPKSGSCGTAAYRAEMVIVTDMLQDPLWEDHRELVRGHDLRAAWSRPLISTDGRVLGVVAMYDHEARSPNAYQLRLVESMAHLAGIAIERQQAEDLMQQTEAAERERAAELEAVRQASLGLTQKLELTEVLDEVLHAAFRLMRGAKNTHIFLYDVDTDRLTFGAAVRADGRLVRPWAEPRPRGLTYTVARTGQMIAVENMNSHPLYADAPRHWGGAIVGFPLRIGDRVVGVMNVAYALPRSFSESELRRLSLLADHAAIAIENARLFQAEREAREQAEALREVAATLLTADIDRERILQLILEQLARVVDYDSASIMLIEGTGLTMPASRGLRAEIQTRLSTFQLQSMKHVQEVISTRQAVIIQDTTVDPRWQQLEDPNANYIRCWMGVPLVVKDAVIGVLNLDKEQPGSYNEWHAGLASAFANQSAVAIEHSRLYEALAQETQRLELLNQVGRDLSARLDLEQVYAAIYRATTQLMPCDAFLITLLGDMSEEIELVYLIDQGQRWPGGRFPAHRGLSGLVIKTAKAVRIDNLEQFAGVDVIRFGSPRHALSALMVPMILGDRVIGTLSAQSYTEYVYSTAEEQTLSTLAYQAAIAIENARLYTEIQQQLEDQTLLYECAQALALVHDTTAVLTTVAERVVARCNATSMSYYSHDEAANTCRVDYEYWTDRATERERRSVLGQTADLSRFPQTVIALTSRTPQITRNGDPRLTPQEQKSLDAFDGKCIITAPVILHDKAVGFFEVWNSQRDYPYTDKDKRLLLALATQAAIALENAQLYAATKRQSLELSTLLEAARAVSSTRNLEDIIALIARQMAISTNAVGCTISKWDEAADKVITWVTWRQRQMEFIDKPGSVYPLSRFPATRAVLRHRQIKLITATDTTADPAEIAVMNSANIASLLMFPLAVGDRVIGLVEVYEDAPERKFAADEINLIQGMANQAAIAIANAQLFEASVAEKRRLELLFELSQNLATTLDPREVAMRALEQICASFDAFQGAIYVVEPDSNRLRLVALTDADAARVEHLNREMDFRLGVGLTGWVAREQQPTVVDDVTRDSRWIPIPDLDANVCSLIAAPLIVGNTLVGVINLSGSQPGAFHVEQLPLLSAAATPVAAALHNARLFEETRRQADEVKAASSILHTLTASPDITVAFPAIAAGLKAMTHCERVSLALLDETHQNVTIAALDQQRPELNRGLRFPVSATAAATDVLDGRPHLTPDLAAEARFPAEKQLYDAGHRSRINVPLRVGTQVIGALNIVWPHTSGYIQVNFSLMSQIADALALAIEKSRFFEESQRRDAILQSLAYGSQCLLMPGELADNLMLALANLGQVIGVSRAYIFENYTDVNSELLASQRFEWCAPGAASRIENPVSHNLPYAGAMERWYEVLGSGQPLYGLVRTFPQTERAIVEPDGIRSLAVVPIFSSGSWWGYLGFDDCENDRIWTTAEIETLKSAAATLGVAFARQRSEAAEREQRALVEALRDTASALNSTLNYDEVLDRILENVGRVVPHDAANIALIDEATDETYVVRRAGYRLQPDYDVTAVRLSLADAPNLQQMIVDKHPCVIADTQEFSGWVAMPETQWVRSYLGAPIVVRDRVIGFLNLDSRMARFFTAAQAEHLQAFANEAAIAIQNAQLFAATQRHMRTATLLNEITRAALEAADFEESLQSLADRLGQLVNADGCYITLWDESRQQPIPMVAYGVHRDRYASPVSRSLPGETTLTASVLRVGHTLIVEDVRNSPHISSRLLDVYSGYPLHSILALPLVVGDKKLGAVLTTFSRPHIFTAEEVAISEQAAGQVALAIFKDRLLEAEREQRVMAEALRDTAAALNSTLNFDAVLERILSTVGRVVPHDSASIMLADDPAKGIDPVEGVVRIVRCQGFAERGLETWAMNLRFRVGDSPKMQAMIGTRRPIIIQDTHEDPGWIDFPETRWIRSYMGAPIGVRGWIIGFINLDSTMVGFFSEIHANRLQVFADQAAVAIENAYLYESIRQNADELSVLYRAAAELIKPGASLETAATQIASIVIREFKASHCAVLLMDESLSVLRRIVQLGDLEVSCPAALPLNGPGLIAAAGRTDQVVYAPDIRLDDRYLEGNTSTRSEIAVPLKGGGRVIGVLNLESPQVDAFDSRARRMIVAFAERAGLALENTQLLARLDLARQAAEEASQLKSEFLANTSHELRTPLTGIIGSLSMVLDNRLTPPEEREFVQIAYTASEHLLDIINNVLDIAKIESGRLDIESKALSLTPIFGELYGLTRVQADEKKLRLELHLPSDPTAKVWADPDKLRQILLNLIGNAIKFTERGSVIVNAEAQGDWMRITVRDTGVGIPSEKQQRIFQPFVQADGSMTRRYGGTGLGLSISQQLAEMMGGSLTLQSEGANRGATLTLTLPLAGQTHLTSSPTTAAHD